MTRKHKGKSNDTPDIPNVPLLQRLQANLETYSRAIAAHILAHYPSLAFETAQSYLIADHASQQGIPLIVLTDLFCDWASRLMVNSVIRVIGPRVEQRLEKLTRLHQTFTGYTGHQPPTPRHRNLPEKRDRS